MHDSGYSLPPQVFEQLASVGQACRFEDGDVLFHEGDECDDLYVLISGRLKVYSVNDAGRKVVFNVAKPGEILGEMFLDGGPRSASVKSVGKTECLMVDAKATQTLLRTSPEFAESLVKLLIARLRLNTRKTRSLALDGVYERIVALMEEYAVPSGTSLLVPPELTQQEIAHRIGASREMVNHILRDLVRGGFISKDRRHRMTIVRKLPQRW